jgi:Ni/Co efflux regulator RcnB
MKRLLCAVAALAMMTPQVAAAQSHGRDKGKTHKAERTQTKKTTSQSRSAPARAQRTQVTRTTRVRQSTQTRARSNPVVRTTRVTRQTVVARPTVRANARVQTRTQRRAGYHPAQVRRVHATTYRYPRGYSYRRWNSGSILPRLFRSSAYYYTNWYSLGFGPPPPGYAWVRYGPDLLLVNIYTGRIRDVVYGVFY